MNTHCPECFGELINGRCPICSDPVLKKMMVPQSWHDRLFASRWFWWAANSALVFALLLAFNLLVLYFFWRS